jgi:hypothetical protein
MIVALMVVPFLYREHPIAMHLLHPKCLGAGGDRLYQISGHLGPPVLGEKAVGPII